MEEQQLLNISREDIVYTGSSVLFERSEWKLFAIFWEWIIADLGGIHVIIIIGVTIKVELVAATFWW